MLVEYVIEKYIDDTRKTLNTVTENIEIKHLETLLDLLNTNRYVIEAMTKEFDIANSPEYVYLFDLKRCMFWKPHAYGYTRDIYSAGVFELRDAIAIAQRDCDTKIVYFD